MRCSRMVAVLFLFNLAFSPALILASESCSMLGGKCRDACTRNARAESGDFEDCGGKQECCVVHDAEQDAVKCCIASFEAANFGPQNCSAPVNNACPGVSRSPVPCEKMPMCRERR